MKTRSNRYDSVEHAGPRGVQVYLRKVKRPSLGTKCKGTKDVGSKDERLVPSREEEIPSESNSRQDTIVTRCESSDCACPSMQDGRFSQLFMGGKDDVTGLQAQADAYLKASEERDVREFRNRWGFDARKGVPVHHPRYEWII